MIFLRESCRRMPLYLSILQYLVENECKPRHNVRERTRKELVGCKLGDVGDPEISPETRHWPTLAIPGVTGSVRASTEGGPWWGWRRGICREPFSWVPIFFASSLTCSLVPCPSPTQGYPPQEGPEEMPRLWVQTLPLPLISCMFLDKSFTPSGLSFWACGMGLFHKVVQSQ